MEAARGESDEVLPKHVVKRGKTPVLSEDQARRLLESIKVANKVALPDGSEAEVPWLVGLRDRALIGVMVYTFARISAVVAMEVEDYFPNGKRWWVRLQEKGGKRHEMPAHHKLSSSSMSIWPRPASAIMTPPLPLGRRQNRNC